MKSYTEEKWISQIKKRLGIVSPTKAFYAGIKERLNMMNEKISKIQKQDNLNNVYRYGDAGPGGAYHEYDIYKVDETPETGEPLTVIRFQKGPRNDPNAIHGVLDEDLLEIVRDRMICFQAGDFATAENAHALRHIEEALMWLNKRKEDRKERSVLGTYQK